MPKRPNPYADEFVPQNKTHIGLKQFNNTPDRLRLVYEKTLQLLLHGAKKSLQSTEQPPSAAPAAQHALHAGPERTPHARLTQLHIRADGSLRRDGPAAGPARADARGCACAGAAGRCAYCEVSLCSDCARDCLLCAAPYCARCCLHPAEGSGAVCLSCWH